MPRSGGESDKLGNRYEAIWTIGKLLELARGEARTITIEPFGEESRGIEFVVRRLDDGREFHSAKRQRSEGEWSLATLARKNRNTGRSILKDIDDKLAASDDDACYFVSSTGANDFRELTERARQRSTFVDFEKDLNTEASDALRRAFEKYVQPLTGSGDTAYKHLQRMHVALVDEATLRRQVEQHISYLVYRPNSEDFSPKAVLLLLGDFVLANLGTELSQEDVWRFLATEGYSKRDWASDSTIEETVQRQNQRYIETVDADLINGTRIPRPETERIVDAIIGESSSKTVVASASAGMGKSCVVAQCVALLRVRKVPSLVVRLDRHADAHSTHDIGTQMDLPRSPAVVLAAIANGQESVLLIDQLDAVSQVSGRYPHLWQVFSDLSQEVGAYPNMRLLVVCRDFDLANDPRLRKLTQPASTTHVAIALLPPADVESAIAARGYSVASLTPAQKELLRTPLHLFLFLEGINSDHSDVIFSNIGDLFDRYWECKQRAVAYRLNRNADWIAVIDKLSDAMSAQLALYVPSLALDEYADTKAAMLTEHVLVEDGHNIRFFHESFFDYAFARRFIAKGGAVMELLLSGEQHLFRRSQVRQLLAYMRDHLPEQYLVQLRDLLASPRVRFNIKRLVLGWLGTLAHPMPGEWDIVSDLSQDKDIERNALPPVRNSLAWFDLLLSTSVIANWLSSGHEETIHKGLWFLMREEVQKQRSAEFAELLSPYRNRDTSWINRLKACFRFGNAHCSPEAQSLFLAIIDDGAFDAQSRAASGDMWTCLRQAGELAPQFALKAILHWLDRQITELKGKIDRESLDSPDRNQSGVQLILALGSQVPMGFVTDVLPRIIAIVGLSTVPSDDRLQLNKVWTWLNNAPPMRISAALLQSTVGALEEVSRTSPRSLDFAISSLKQTKSLTLTFVLLRTFSANPAFFTNECIEFLLEDLTRLEVGYSSWSDGGNGHAAVSREVIAACTPHATPEQCKVLEDAILSHTFRDDDSEYPGWVQCLLLESFDGERLSESGRVRLADLRLRFPDQDKQLPPKISSSLAKAVGSPIPMETAQQFTDDEWLAAMRNFNYGWDSPRPTGAPMGSAVELSRILKAQAKVSRKRFAALTQRMDDAIRAEYFEAILDGICESENHPTGDQSENGDFEQLDTETIMSVVRRLHELPGHPCGRSACHAFATLAARPIDSSDLSILAYYAVDDPNPKSDEWIEYAADKDRDPAESAHFYGYNSVRGQAARAIESLLFADYSRLGPLIPSIHALISDRSLAVRTCAVEVLLPILNHDRDEAVRLFVEACSGAESVLGSQPFETFLHHASSTHYLALRDLLLTQLGSASASTVRAAARQICLAEFTDGAAANDASAVRHGSEPMREAAAEVYAYNVAESAVGAVCKQFLPLFFNDESEGIRTAASRCFSHLDDADLREFADLIFDYIESPAFTSEHYHLFHRLEESTWQLPDVTIRLAERFVEEYSTDAGDISTAASGDAPTVAKLVIRLYSQSPDSKIRIRCLDLIDEMERLGFYGIDSQLAELER